MRQLVLGVIGVLWGGAVVIFGLANGFSSGSYGGGQLAAFVFGFVLLLAGGRAIMKYRSSRAAATV